MAKNNAESPKTTEKQVEALRAEAQAEREAKMAARSAEAEAKAEIKRLRRDMAKRDGRQEKLTRALEGIESHVENMLAEVRRLTKEAKGS